MLTFAFPVSTLETVAGDTPASFAIVYILIVSFSIMLLPVPGISVNSRKYAVETGIIIILL